MTLAISAAATAMPVKPRTPAMIATIKNVYTQDNIINSLSIGTKFMF